MCNVFVTSDTHFFHHKILQFEAMARPFATVEEMNEKLIDNWNNVVTKRDLVYHLGDVLFGGVKNLHILDRLNGNKKLILGNHDDKINVRDWLTKFREIYGSLKYDNCLLTHVPIHPGQFYRFHANIHGHLHSKKIMMFDETFNEPYEDDRYINVSCEHTNLTPIAWDEIKKRIPNVQ